MVVLDAGTTVVASRPTSAPGGVGDGGGGSGSGGGSSGGSSGRGDAGPSAEQDGNSEFVPTATMQAEWFKTIYSKAAAPQTRKWAKNAVADKSRRDDSVIMPTRRGMGR